MNSIIEILQNIITAFDLIVLLIVIYSIAECAGKGFLRSMHKNFKNFIKVDNE